MTENSNRDDGRWGTDFPPMKSTASPLARPGRRPRWRSALALVLVWVPVAALLAVGPAWLDRLPELTASHWGASGPADGFTASTPFWLWTTGLAAAAAVVATLVVLVATSQSVVTWALLAGAYGASLAAVVWLTSAHATLQAGAAEEAVLGAGFLVGLLVAIVVWPGLVYLAAGNFSDPRPEAPVPAAPLPLADTERAAWSTVLTSRMFTWIAVVYGFLTVAIVVLAIVASGDESWVGWFGVVVLLVAAPPVVALTRITVSVDQRGLRVIGLGGVPFARIRPEQIASVRAEHIEPMEWGGWGLRWTPGRYAVVTRRGPGLVVQRETGNWFAVTIDEPDQPAALLESLRQRAQNPPS